MLLVHLPKTNHKNQGKTISVLHHNKPHYVILYNYYAYLLIYLLTDGHYQPV